MDLPEKSSDDASSNKFTHLNDVSRMSCCPVSRIFYPRREADVANILQSAHQAQKQVGIRGTKHSMGGHSICKLGWEIDTKYLRHIQYIKDDSQYNQCVVRCGPGCQWSDLIKALNHFGKSPRTMQSYCTFSVGGTLAVNAHGITTDYCFAESVLEFRLARVNPAGKAEIVICRRPGPNNHIATKNEEQSLGNELFGLVLGGYGCFGVITDVVLKVEDNVQLELDSLQLHPIESSNNDEHDGHSRKPSNFVRIYDNCRRNGASKLKNFDLSIGKVEMKIARLNTTNLSKASMYVLRRSGSCAVMSNLPATPKELSPTSQLLYKWILPLYTKQRYNIEEKKGEALDMAQDDFLTRNQLLFESAVSLSKLYEPLVKKDDTFVLQEYFCPHANFPQWIKRAQPIYNDIANQQKDEGQSIILLNTTIRYVEEDDITFLRYSRSSEGVFAFVLYYRIKRDFSVEKRLGEFHNRLAEVTLDLGGAFYLPYRKCYSNEMLRTAYPMINDFAKKKEILDPDCMFSNLWFDHYILPLCSTDYIKKTYARYHNINTRSNPQYSFHVDISNEGKSLLLPKGEFWNSLPRREDSNMLRRKNSYRCLLRSKKSRDEFRNQFLVNVFNIADADEVMRTMTRAAWDPANCDDIHIYRQIFYHFHGESGNAALNLTQYWRGIQQIRRQKGELIRQTVNILENFGMIGSINNYVCVGDHGKIVTELVNKLHMKGKIWVVHDSPDINDSQDATNDSFDENMPSIATVLERGSLDSVAHEEIAYDYVSHKASEKLSRIPSEAADLVSMNQGLHHIPLDKLFDFLSEVYRILCPGGVFIIREHDLKISTEESKDTSGKTLYPMLDLAHSVFNAVTGVAIAKEEEEIRAFRPILEWREILERVGFIDTMIYEVEDDDPTCDEMLAFCKPCPLENDSHQIIEKIQGEIIPPIAKQIEPPIVNLIHTFLGQIPRLFVSNAQSILLYIKHHLPQVQDSLIAFLHNVISSAVEEVTKGIHTNDFSNKVIAFLETQIASSSKQWIELVDGLLSLLSQSEVQEVYNFRNILEGLSTELFLVLPYLQRKLSQNKNECNSWEAQLISFINTYFPALLYVTEDVDNNASEGDAADKNSADIGNNTCSESSHSNINKTVSGVEVEVVLKDLANLIPGILDSEKVLLRSGFTLPQQVALVRRFGGTDLPTTCEVIADYLDQNTWEELKIHLQAAGSSGDLPTKELLLSPMSKEHGIPTFHPWHYAFKKFLMAPDVQIKRQGIFALRMMGMDAICVLYKEAKKEYEKNSSSCVGSTEQVDTPLLSHMRNLDHYFGQSIQSQAGNLEEKTIVFDSRFKRQDLFNVAEVIEAKFGYISATSRLVDITRDLQILHSQVHAKLANPKYNHTKLADSKFNYDIQINKARVGWLPIHEDWLVEVRNGCSSSKRRIDSLRKNVVGISTFGLVGVNRLIIKYRRLTSNNMDETKSASNELCKELASSQLINGNLHSDDGEYTWFKLNEWMQVEILNQFVSSLDHTPWYRFPFMPFLQVYCEVFKKQAKIVQDKYGALTAYGSMAFLTDFIPGVVMSALFGQLQILAIPLLMTTPKEGYMSTDQNRFLEQCVLHVRLPNLSHEEWAGFFKKEVDPRIFNVNVLPHNFVILCTPPFKVMGEILQKVAIRFPSAKLLQISNQMEVQVRILLSPEGPIDLESLQGQKFVQQFLKHMSSVSGVKYMMQYQFPNTDQDSTVHSIDDKTQNSSSKERSVKNGINFSFEVQCISLLDLIRTCEGISCCRIEQIYDFWN